MGVRRRSWVVPAMAALTAVLATLLVQSAVTPRVAVGQVGQTGSAGYVTAVSAAEHQGRVPLFVVDNKSQAIMIYEYDLSRRRVYLRCVRSFENDRRVVDNTWDRSINRGPSVRDVQKYIANQ